MDSTKVKCVLVIYTGGKMGMLRDKDGNFQEVKKLFEDRIRQDPKTHDPHVMFELEGKGQIEDADKWLAIRWVTRQTKAQTLKSFFELVFISIRNVRCRYTLLYQIMEYGQLLDPSNMDSEDWVKIAGDIGDNYDRFNGFVVIHGTDLLCITATALSFLLENLRKPVIITGSQIPIYETHNDAENNFLNSLKFATVDEIKEVCVCFNKKLMRGNRTVVLSTATMPKIDSLNYPDLAGFSADVTVNHGALLVRTGAEPLRVHRHLERKIRKVKIEPLSTLEMMQDSLEPPTRGLVLVTYGYGNIPTKLTGYVEAVETAIKTHGIIIINVTEVSHGSLGNYHPFIEVLTKIGVINGHDMTASAALCKLAYVLGREDWTFEERKEALQRSICGEINLPN